MKTTLENLFRVALGSCSMVTLASISLAQQSNPANEEDSQTDDEVLQMSPFVLEEDSNVGYRATATLAGSRLRMPLRDVGSAIQVVTKELMDDLGATDASTLLSYTMNTETGGTQGNFAGGGSDSGGNRSDQNAARINPQTNQRVRGLGEATLTRDFFLTSIPFDTYNSTQVTINRGPNAILFGVGSPGGIIDNSLNKAQVSKNFGEVKATVGDNGTHRLSFDLNQMLIPDRLAIRVAGLDEARNYDQKPAYQNDARIYAAIEAVLFKNENSDFLGNTVIRANYEQGNMESNPAMVVPPRNLYNNWWSTLPRDYYEPYTGALIPEIFTTDFESQHTVNINTAPNGTINTATTPTIAWTSVFDQGALVFQNPDDQVPNAGSASYPNANGLQGRLTFYPGAKRYEWFATQGFEGQGYAVGFVYPSIQDRNVFDYHNELFSGDTSYVDRDFETVNVTFEQLFFKNRNAGIEISYDQQEWTPYWQTPVDDSLVSIYSNADIQIDISENLGNGDPNPNLGRPFVRINDLGGYKQNQIDREAVRATAFYKFDFEDIMDSRWGKILGNHTLTGFYGEQTSDVETRYHRASWNTDEVPVGSAFSGRAGAFFRTVVGIAYVGPSALTASGPQDVRISPINIAVPQIGDSYNLWYQGPTGRARTDDSIKNNNFYVEGINYAGNVSQNTIESQAFTLQSRLLSDHLIGLFGWRTDEATSYEALTASQVVDLSGSAGTFQDDGNLKVENYFLQDEPSSVEEGDTFTASVVAHVPDAWTEGLPLSPRLSFHWGESENFSPAGLRRNVNLEVIGPPTGETSEMGFSVELAKKHHLRFNWFETTSSGANSGLNAALVSNRQAYRLERMIAEPLNTGWTFEQTKAAATEGLSSDPIPNINSYAELEAAIIGLIPAELQQQFNYRVEQINGTYQVQSDSFGGQVATASVKAKGFEVDFVTNPTPNWRLMFNLSKQETVQSDSAPLAKELSDLIVANIQSSGLGDLRVSPTFGANETVYGEFNRLVLVPLNGILAKDGTTSLEQRKWRANFVTNYRFSRDTMLKGFSVGGAVRWQDEVGIGYGQIYTDEAGIVPDLNNPFFAPSQWAGDMWLSYQRKLTDKIDWKVQLNLRNVLGSDEDIPVRANPDGSIATIRIPNEKAWFLTNTFAF
ncbi:TonB-dependent receptor plug domain-containing protein [Synoicihabitans lomoniglobus]|uniref:TonB-dependent receptor plug domain-containing protein n=1 Tax=Synoicihabitans lomoniglobus TaxID=2909285 RepID=A0AAF0CHA6_9BACT|nr:hypothetical protein [Opitutaceae bacterium LMO-M01]WED64067.1 hypothetical protein PXH66_17150 [Opitutaceae bacterium LMO-M01]